MQEFFGHVEYVKRNIIVIREATTRVGEINQQVHELLTRLTPHVKHTRKIQARELTYSMHTLKNQVVLATTNEHEQDESKELAVLITNTNKKAAVAKQLLKKLREDTEALKLKPGPKQSEIRIRENLASTLTRKFVDVMKEYQNAQTKYKTDIKKKVKRQVQIIKPDATAEEIDAVLKSGGGSGEIMKGAILKVSELPLSAPRISSMTNDVFLFDHEITG